MRLHAFVAFFEAVTISDWSVPSFVFHPEQWEMFIIIFPTLMDLLCGERSFTFYLGDEVPNNDVSICTSVYVDVINENRAGCNYVGVHLLPDVFLTRFFGHVRTAQMYFSHSEFSEFLMSAINFQLD